MDTHNTHGEHGESKHAASADGKKLFGILCYLGPLVILPLLTKSEDEFLKFHAKQGLVLLIIQIFLWFVLRPSLMWPLWPVYQIIYLGLVVLSIIGISNILQGKEKELPLVGGFAHYFKF